MSDPHDHRFHFRDWMDERKYRAAEVAPRFGISNQTVFNWRSNGVPESRQDFVARIISEWPAGPLGPRLVIKTTEDQYERWSRAQAIRSIRKGEPLTLEEWAVEGLDELATELLNDPQMKFRLRSLPTTQVAEDETPYQGGQSGTGAK